MSNYFQHDLSVQIRVELLIVQRHLQADLARQGVYGEVGLQAYWRPVYAVVDDAVFRGGLVIVYSLGKSKQGSLSASGCRLVSFDN